MMFSPFAFLSGSFDFKSFMFAVDKVQAMLHRARSFAHDLPPRDFTMPHRHRDHDKGTHIRRNFWVGK